MEAPQEQEILGWSNLGGGYLIFIDSDDWLEPNALQNYSNVIKTDHPDIIKGGFEIDDSKNGIQKVYSLPRKMELTDITEIFLITEKYSYGGFLWDTAFKRELISNLKFDKKLKWLEDHLFSFDAFARCQKMICIPEVTYHYMVNQGESLSNIKDAKVIYNAANLEYEKKMILAKGNEEALQLNIASYNSKLSMSIHTLYRYYNYSSRHEFYKQNQDIHSIRPTDRAVRIFYLKVPFILKDAFIVCYLQMKRSKSALKSFVKLLFYKH